MENGIIFQAYEWYLSDEGGYYKDMVLKLDELKEIGVTAIGLPPVYKATGTNDVGYGTYDLYDLGEFHQRGSVRTKYGTKEELKDLISEIHKREMSVYADVVLNHKAGADRAERFEAVLVDEKDRTKEVGEVYEIDAWTAFDFPGRGYTYSKLIWNYNHFTGVDFDNLTGTKGSFGIIGENKGWSLGVSGEKGNFDYLMFADIDLSHPAVVEELKAWALWFIDELDLDGFRMDALKHMDKVFVKDFLSHIKEAKGDKFYILGEYWSNHEEENNRFLEEIDFKSDLFDVGLHFNLHQASQNSGDYDLRQIFDGSLVKSHPSQAVSFVDNHDSQLGQSLQSWVAPWFKEIAYGIILLRKEGYPCIFYGDYYGTKGENPQEGLKDKIDILAKIRKDFAHGEQQDYFQSTSSIGWVRLGDEDHPHKCATLISSGDSDTIKMFLGEEEAGKIYADFTGNSQEKITVDDEGYGAFQVGPGSISVWVEDGTKL